MNANVGIELGYALRSLSDRSLLFVLNGHYGSRQDLPFDLAHKAGPIIYSLAENANSAAIGKERKRLVATLKAALKPYVNEGIAKVESAPFDEVAVHPETGAFYEPYKSLAGIGEKVDGDYTELSLPAQPYVYLRLVPTRRLERPLKKSDLVHLIDDDRLPTFSQNQSGFVRPNAYGAAMAEPRHNATNELRSITQIFPNGEIWGISQELIVDRNGSTYIPTGALEKALEFTLSHYVRFARDKLSLALPVRVVFGAVGLKGVSVAFRGSVGTEFWPLKDDKMEVRAELGDYTEGAQLTIRETFMDELFEATGYRRPK